MPDWRSLVRARLAEASLAPVREADVIEELTQHVEDRYRDALARGLPESDAAKLAVEELESNDSLARVLTRLHQDPAPPPIGGPPSRPFAGVWQDLRYAARLLLKSPAFTLATVITIALCTGPTITALGVANWLFVRPLPGTAEPARLGTLWFGRWSDGNRSHSPSRVSYTHVDLVRTQLKTVRGIAGQTMSSVTVSAGEQEPQLVPAQFVTANFFDVLGVRLIAGRPFRADDDNTVGGSPVAILDAAFARTWFGGVDSAVGRTLRVNGDVYQVVGVADEAFQGVSLTRRPSLWLPGLTSPRASHFPVNRWSYEPGRGPFSEFVVRLAPGATFDEAQAELRVAVAGLVQSQAGDIFKTVVPTLYAGVGVEPFSRQPMWEFVRLILFVGVALVALGAANLANLFAFRSARRMPEAAVRRALGASAGRLARLPLFEALLVALAGASLGLWLAFAVRSALETVPIPGFGKIAFPVDWRLFAMAIGVATVVAVLLSIVPARVAARADLAGVFGRSTRGGTHASRRVRTGLAIIQVALSLTLLIGSLLFVRTMRNLSAVDLGFEPSGVSQMSLALQQQGYVGRPAMQFQRDLLTRLRDDRSIAAAALALYTPFGGASWIRQIRLPGQDATSTIEVTSTDISPDYFRALALPLVAGRTFTDDEAYAPGPEAVVILSEALAVKLFGVTAAAVGRAISLPETPAPHDATVIGIARDARWLSFDQPELFMYRPLTADGRPQALLVRSSRSPDETLRQVRAAVRQLDPSVPVMSVTLESNIAARQSQQRLRAWVLSILAVIGFVLAAVGIHGLVSQSVVERLREFGIRRAVGAGATHVARLVLRQAALVAAVGIPVGLGLALLLARFVEAQLFGVAATSLAVYAASGFGLALVVLLACVGPARRALRVDPVDVLRAE